MKRYTESAIILFAVLAFVGCSKTEEFQHNPDSALQIESVSGISPFALTTKAVITGNTLPDSDAATGIGIFVTASDGSAYDGHNKGYTNVNFANSGSGWSTATPVYLSDTEGKLYGYFPYNSNANGLKAIPVQSSLNGTDYLYAEPQTVNHSNKNVSLTMNHALSRLHLTVKKGANFTADAPLSKITLNSTAIDATGTMDLTTGAITASKGADETGTVELATDGTITAEGIEKDILLVPADNSEGKKDIALILTIGGKLASVSLPGENGIDIRSGIQNNVTLTIEDTGVKVSGVGVGEWGEGGSQQVQVGAHTVTVKFLETDEGIADDLLTNMKADGGNVKIQAYSKSGKSLSCVITGNATCTKVMADNICSFTISDITSNVTAIVEYKKAEIINLDRTSVNPALGWRVSLSAEVLPEDTVIKDVIWSSNNETIARVDDYGTVTTFTEGEAIITATAKDGSGVTTTCKITVGPAMAGSLSGEFSVSPNKKVHFSQGNLYYDGSVEAFKFESNQYDFHTYDSSSNTWGLFGWSTSETYGMSTSTTPSDYSGNFLDWGTAIDNKSTWTTLSGGESGEWKYLFDHHVNIWGNCNSVKGRFIAPDNFVGGTSALSAIVSDWKTAQDVGIVFLPAAGYRYGSDVYNVGVDGLYWSSTAFDGYYAYHVYFYSYNVFPDNYGTRDFGSSVRLITESY